MQSPEQWNERIVEAFRQYQALRAQVYAMAIPSKDAGQARAEYERAWSKMHESRRQVCGLIAASKLGYARDGNRILILDNDGGLAIFDRAFDMTNRSQKTCEDYFANLIDYLRREGVPLEYLGLEKFCRA